MNNKRVSGIVTGRVQGVWFRGFTSEQAFKLSLTGWVKNLPDGTVQFIAEGDQNNLKTFIDQLHKGPIVSRVDKVVFEWLPCKNEFKTFKMVY